MAAPSSLLALIYTLLFVEAFVCLNCKHCKMTDDSKLPNNNAEHNAHTASHAIPLPVPLTTSGAEVIAENIRREGDINPMVPGRKMVAIFGFCDIRRFTDATEVLQVSTGSA